MRIEILGQPAAKARHRTVIRRKKVVTYDPQHDLKAFVRQQMVFKLKEYSNSEDKEKVLEASRMNKENSFEVRMHFYLPIPRSLNAVQKNRILWGLKETTSKPDLDNLVKFYLDCANGIFFPDDKCIVNRMINAS